MEDSSSLDLEQNGPGGRGPMFKVVLLGEVGVGKTSLFNRIKDDTFKENTKVTTGIDSCSKVMNYHGQRVTLSIWDTAGVERFRTLTRNYYRSTHATILVYDVTEPSTLHYLPKWVDDVTAFSPNAIKALIGNKIDLESKVEERSEEDFSSVYDCDIVCRASACTGDGVADLLKKLTEMLMQEFKSKHRNNNVNDLSVRLTDPRSNENNESTCFC